MEVEIHIAGITDDDEVEMLMERLDGMGHVEVQAIEETRVRLSYDDDRITANEIQSQIEAAGAEVITLDPVADGKR